MVWPGAKEAPDTSQGCVTMRGTECFDLVKPNHWSWTARPRFRAVAITPAVCWQATWRRGNKKAGEVLSAKRLSEAPVAREPLPLCSYTANSSYSDITGIISPRLRGWGSNGSQSSDVMVTPGKARLFQRHHRAHRAGENQTWMGILFLFRDMEDWALLPFPTQVCVGGKQWHTRTRFHSGFLKSERLLFSHRLLLEKETRHFQSAILDLCQSYVLWSAQMGLCPQVGLSLEPEAMR